jgi:two-component system, chemotaxis family, chemotaxis protein CheY
MSGSILLVDDSPMMRRLLGATLRAADYRVIEARDGEEALDYARAQHADLVLTDLNMPHMDGIVLIAHLRTLASYQRTPVVLLTIESSPERKLQGRRAGATGWITKPVSPRQLLGTLARLLSQPVRLEPAGAPATS